MKLVQIKKGTNAPVRVISETENAYNFECLTTGFRFWCPKSVAAGQEGCPAWFYNTKVREYQN